jgi:Ca-activated chloride channel homolog
MTTANALARNDRQYSSLVSVDGRTYPLKSASINARAEGGIAATTLAQTYENPYAEALEVLYTLPLPADGAVTGYTIRLGNRVIRGEVRKREEAREEYRKALLTGRTAALIEQERADTFSQRLGSLPPGETAIVEIEVLQPLSFLPGAKDERHSWEYRFPTVAGVRYEGAENRVPDAEKLDVDRAAEGLAVRVEATLLIADPAANRIRPYSPNQQLRAEETGDGIKVILEEGMPLNRDLVVRWAAGQQETGVRTVEGKGLPCDNGRYLLITLTPPNDVMQAVSRDLMLLIDCSGSMSGQPLEQAKTIAMELLHSLEPGDRFEILAFSNKVHRLVSGPVDVKERSVGNALGELRKLKASGSTEMTKALIEALKPLRPGSQRQVILLSDGYIGFEHEVIGEISRRLVPGARVHVVGVGSAPNRTLTKGASRAGCGSELIVGLEEDAKKAAAQLLQATVHPVLMDIAINGSGLMSCAPQKPRDVFAGRPALIFAEVRPEGGRLEISGRIAGNSSPWLHAIDVPPLVSNEKTLGSTPIPIGALFGREAIEDSEIDLTVSRDQSEEIKKRIESLGLRHGISSRMTSMIALSEDPTVDPTDPRRRERLPVEMPAGVSAEGAGLRASRTPGFFSTAPAAMPVAMEAMNRMEYGEPRSSYISFRSKKVLDRITNMLTGSKPEIQEESELQLGEVSIERQAPILIEGARVLYLKDQILVFEFETPVNGFMLPDRRAEISVVFNDGVESRAIVIEKDSSKPGPHVAGLTIRLALRFENSKSWNHKTASIRWPGLLQQANQSVDVDVVIPISLAE